jgi:hypothetical protein
MFLLLRNISYFSFATSVKKTLVEKTTLRKGCANTKKKNSFSIHNWKSLETWCSNSSFFGQLTSNPCILVLPPWWASLFNYLIILNNDYWTLHVVAFSVKTRLVFSFSLIGFVWTMTNDLWIIIIGYLNSLRYMLALVYTSFSLLIEFLCCWILK